MGENMPLADSTDRGWKSHSGVVFVTVVTGMAVGLIDFGV